MAAVQDSSIRDPIRGRPTWGEAVAAILPMDDAPRITLDARILTAAREHADCRARLDALAAEIGAAWTSDKSAQQLVEEQRRDL